MVFKRNLASLFVLVAVSTASLSWATDPPTADPAPPVDARWIGSEDSNSDLAHVLTVLEGKTGIHVDAAELLVFEDRELATSHFKMWVRTVAGIPVKGQSIRLWTDLSTGKTIQAEARVASITKAPQMHARLAGLKSALQKDLKQLARQAIVGHEDAKIYSWKKWDLEWMPNGELVRVGVARGRRGNHSFVISVENQKVLSHTYTEFPQAEFSLPALVYPVYEEADSTVGTLLPRVKVRLTHLNAQVVRPTDDIYGPLRQQTYTDVKNDNLLGATEDGRKQGYWSMPFLKDQAAKIRATLPLDMNTFMSGGVLLNGKYATVSIHPGAITAAGTALNFTPGWSAQLFPLWTTTVVDGEEVGAMIPQAARLGRPLKSYDDAYNRVAQRLADHDPVKYLNDGFDEVQVYYSITTLMESLQARGFTDLDLSTRPFNAFLYDPDVGNRDNAYYTDDTINFSTYSPTAPNYARDNSTIWHELGHGVMDRLMGDAIQLADTGGLSEGMADFVAAMVIADKMAGQTYPGMNDYRIINQTGFNLTNEVHDDGEAYGGSMNDFLQSAIKAYGQDGLAKVVDLTMETMRLTRNNPGLTADGWFSHMVFADALGHGKLRRPGELEPLIHAALAGRNFSLGGEKTAVFSLKNGADEVIAGELGSRIKPISLELAPGATTDFTLHASLTEGDAYKFKYPVTVKVLFNKGPLEGAVHWTGEEKEPLEFQITQAGQDVTIPVQVNGKCDSVNREDGSCVDYTYVQIWNNGDTSKPVAKKRFYVRVKNP